MDDRLQNEQAHERGLSSQALIRIVVVAILIAAFVAFMLQNGRTVKLHFLFWQVNTHVAWALLVAGVLGVVIGVLLPRLRRLLF